MIKVCITHSLFNWTVTQIPYSAIEMTRNMSNFVEVSIIVKFWQLHKIKLYVMLYGLSVGLIWRSDVYNFTNNTLMKSQ